MSIDITLVTDGSGYKDGIGGTGSLLTSKALGLYLPTFTASNRTTVDRAEFEALLNGLQSILDVFGVSDLKDVNKLRARQLTVKWTGDRESLVKSVRREYARKKSLDLWARFEFYERIFKIKANLSPRNSDTYMCTVDMYAANMRELMLDYAAFDKVDKHNYELERNPNETN